MPLPINTYYSICEIKHKDYKRQIYFDDLTKPLNEFLDIIETCDVLILGHNFNQDCNNLPNSIKKLIIFINKYDYEIYNLPLEIKEIHLFCRTEVCDKIIFLPHGLEVIYLGCNLDWNKIPSSVNTIKFSRILYANEIQYIPDNIKVIEILGGLSFDCNDKRLSNGDAVYSYSSNCDNDIYMPNKLPIELNKIKINKTGECTYIYNNYISFDLYQEHFTLCKNKIYKLNPNVVIEEN